VQQSRRKENRNIAYAQIGGDRIARPARMPSGAGQRGQENRRLESPERMASFVTEGPPSDQMRLLVRAIIEQDVLPKLAQRKRMPVREVESLRQSKYTSPGKDPCDA
jgi:hypothetical protein